MDCYISSVLMYVKSIFCVFCKCGSVVKRSHGKCGIIKLTFDACKFGFAKKINVQQEANVNQDF